MSARRGKDRIEGVDYIVTQGSGGVLPRRTRKPTLEELEATWALAEQRWTEWCEQARERHRIDRDFLQWTRFEFRFAAALHEEIEERRAKARPRKVKQHSARVRKAPAPRPRTRGHADLIRLRRDELEALGTDAARAEIERRRIKRQRRREARAAA